MSTIDAVKQIQAKRNIENTEGRNVAEAAVRDKVQREIVGALAKNRGSNTMTYRGDKPAEMMRCLQDMEQHYRAALEEKVWEMFEMREANEALAKSVSDTQISRAKEVSRTCPSPSHPPPPPPLHAGPTNPRGAGRHREGPGRRVEPA